MKREPIPQPTIPVFCTPQEAIALGDTILAYHQWLRSLSYPTPEQQAVAELLASFHNRLLSATTVTQNPDGARRRIS